MDIAVFFKGLAFGLSIAAPVGPIGVLCIRRTLTGGLASGFASGLGTATADAAYGLVAGLGFTAAAAFLIDNHLYLRLAGGAFLCYLGVAAFRSQPAALSPAAAAGSLWRDYASAFGLTLANPMTILSFAAVFAGLGVGASGSYAAAAVLVFGVFLGSLCWWLILSVAVSVLRTRLDQQRLRWLNRLSGAVIFCFGLVCVFGP